MRAASFFLITAPLLASCSPFPYNNGTTDGHHYGSTGYSTGFPTSYTTSSDYGSFSHYPSSSPYEPSSHSPSPSPYEPTTVHPPPPYGSPSPYVSPSHYGSPSPHGPPPPYGSPSPYGPSGPHASPSPHGPPSPYVSHPPVEPAPYVPTSTSSRHYTSLSTSSGTPYPYYNQTSTGAPYGSTGYTSLPSSTVSSYLPDNTTSCAPITEPTAPYTVKAYSPGTPIDNLPLNAAGRNFVLGGFPSSYCPFSLGDICPPGNVTAFSFGKISVMVPGGQQQYIVPGGQLGYTQARSISMPPDAIPFGFGYTKCPDEESGRISVSLFGADGLMACPTRVSGTPQYVVYAKVDNLDVTTGELKECIDFVGLTTDYTGRIPAAWQY